jgi:hypothetical protein
MSQLQFLIHKVSKMDIVDLSKKMFEIIILLTGIFLTIWRVISPESEKIITRETNALSITGVMLLSTWVLFIGIPKFISKKYELELIKQDSRHRPFGNQKNYQSEYYLH